jgi:hypothetical protein
MHITIIIIPLRMARPPADCRKARKKNRGFSSASGATAASIGTSAPSIPRSPK